MPAHRRRSLDALAFEHGASYDSYVVTGGGYEYFWSADERGVVAFARRGRYVNVVGRFLAPDGKKAALLDELMAFARERSFVVSFFNMAEADLPLLQSRGFQVTRLGEEPIIPLAGRTWEGGAFSWVRRQESFCTRRGVVLSEERAAGDEVVAVARLGLAGKLQRDELRVFHGQLDRGDLGRRRLFVARSEGGGGRIEGFVLCNPCRGGREWALEMFRHRPDAVRGVVPFAMLQIMRRLAAEGVERVSLCLVPAHNVREPLPGDSRLARWGLEAGSRLAGRIYNTRGLFHFKSRFRPELEPRYVCVWPRASLGSIWAFLRLWGVLDSRLPQGPEAPRWALRGCGSSARG
ncbi:MAG: DUF2156 domain-containing protein [Minicystis sp.]